MEQRKHGFLKQAPSASSWAVPPAIVAGLIPFGGLQPLWEGGGRSEFALSRLRELNPNWSSRGLLVVTHLDDHLAFGVDEEYSVTSALSFISTLKHVNPVALAERSLRSKTVRTEPAARSLAGTRDYSA
jgi:hypothetical protein